MNQILLTEYILHNDFKKCSPLREAIHAKKKAVEMQTLSVGVGGGALPDKCLCRACGGGRGVFNSRVHLNCWRMAQVLIQEF